MLARTPAYCFSRNFSCFRFSSSLKAIKRSMSKVRTIVCCVNIIKMIFVTELRFHEGRRSPVIIWLCLWFSSICFNEISQNVHNLWNLSCRSFKSRKGLHGQFARYLQFCVFFLYLKFGLMNFFCLLTDTRKGTHMFNSPANLRKSTKRNTINLARRSLFSLFHNIT